MTDIILGVGVASFIVYAAFSVSFLISARRTSEMARRLMAHSEANVNASLAELKGTLENIREITGDLNAVTREVRQISEAAAGLERALRGLSGYIQQTFGTAAEANIAGLRAALSTGVATLVQSRNRKGGDDHEGRT